MAPPRPLPLEQVYYEQCLLNYKKTLKSGGSPALLLVARAELLASCSHHERLTEYTERMIDEETERIGASQAVDVDELLKSYPECCRKSELTHYDSSSSEEEDNEEPEVLRVVQGPPQGPPKAPPKENQKPSPVVVAPPGPVPTAPSNPYRQRPQRQHCPPPEPASWDTLQQQNPFRTAREFVQEDTSAAQQPPSSDSYDSHPSRPAGESPPPPQPIIRDSLKRKFQPPTRSAPAKRTESYPGPKTVRPNTTHRPNPQPDNDDDDDELPEELQRFGKELVQKIEHEIMETGDTITFSDIAGLADQKQIVQEVVCWPMKRPDLFTGLRAAPNGLLLYGPPGTGKTLIGKAIAHESGATFFSISSSSLTSKWIGEGEKLVRVLFAVAGYRNPAVVFIDEIDSLLTQRKSDENEASRRIKTEFLVQLDGTGTTKRGRVLVIGATNRPQELDEAARRRFTKRLYIPLPSREDRECLIRVLLKSNHHSLNDADIGKLANDTDGFSGADLKVLCADAALGPIRQLGSKALEIDISKVPAISYKHFRSSLRSMNPSVAPSDLVQYEEWDKTYGTKRVDEDDMSDDEE